MKKTIKQIFLYIGLFLITDIAYSNIFHKKNIKYNCIKHTGNYHFLEKDCVATEKYVKQTKSYKVRTDENGFRFSGKKKDPQKKNIIFLGDSLTYGMGLSYEKTFAGILEQKNENFNFYNLGVAGYSPTVYLYQLKELIKKGIIPTKIFLTLDISDVKDEASKWKVDNSVDHPLYIFNKKVEIDKKNLSFKRKNFKGSRLIARSVNNFFRNVKLTYLSKTNKPIIDPGQTVRGSFLYLDIKDTKQSLWKPIGFQGSIKKIKKNIAEIANISAELNAELYIMVYPWPDTLYYGTKKFDWISFAQEVCSENNCNKLINLFPEFQKVRDNNLNWYYNLYIGNDLHISEKGQKIIVNKLLMEAF